VAASYGALKASTHAASALASSSGGAAAPPPGAPPPGADAIAVRAPCSPRLT
jgi:hypothetical protein